MNGILKTAIGLVALVWFGTVQAQPAITTGDEWLDLMTTRYGDDCRLLHLSDWQHPTRDIMEAADVELHFVALCQGDTYPVFGVDFRYDPRTATDAYFHPLYDAMLRANGGWAYSFLVVLDRITIDISDSGPIPDVRIKEY